jgi:hypothetical protein
MLIALDADFAAIVIAPFQKTHIFSYTYIVCIYQHNSNTKEKINVTKLPLYESI